MKTKTTETTKTTQTITINQSIQDDNGMEISRMTATIASSSPFGNCNMVVLNKNLFEENRDEIKKMYLAFEEEAASTKLEDEDSTVEKDPQTITSEDKEDASDEN